MFAERQAKAPVGSYIVTDSRNGFSEEWPVGKVVAHLKCRTSVRGGGPLLIEKYEVDPEYPEPVADGEWGSIVVSEERYLAAVARRVNAIETMKKCLYNFTQNGKVVNPKALPA